MPRTPLRPISSNIRRGKELTPYQRAIIEGAACAGASIAELSEAHNIPKSTIKDTIKQAPLRHEGYSQPRPGRPQKTSEADKRLILRIVRKDPSLTYKQLREATRLEISHDIFYRILKAAGITNWIAKKRLKLTKAVAKKRLVWAKAYEDWTEEQWANIIWLDECSAERGMGK